MLGVYAEPVQRLFELTEGHALRFVLFHTHRRFQRKRDRKGSELIHDEYSEQTVWT